MKHVLIILSTACALTLASSAWADSFNDATDGKWDASDFDTWGAGAGVYPDAGDAATVDSHTVTLTGNLLTADSTAPDMITLSTGGTLYSNRDYDWECDSPLTLSGGAIQSRGRNDHWDLNGAVTATAGTTSIIDPDYPSDPVRSTIEMIGALSGAGNITKNGTGYLRLNNDTSAYTGTITINGGIVQLLQSMTPAGASPTVIVNSGGTLRNDNNLTCTDWNLQLNDGSTLYFNSNANSNSYFEGGTAVLSGAVTMNVNSGAGGQGTYNGDVSGTGSLTVTRSTNGGAFNLGGDNSAYSGTIIIPTDNTLKANSATALGTGLVTVGGTLAAGFDLNAGNVRIEGGRVTNGNLDRTLGSGLTVELTAAGGGFFVDGQNRTMTVDAKVTGGGALAAMGNDFPAGPGAYTNVIKVTNPLNDYHGGTSMDFTHARGAYTRGQLVVTDTALGDGAVLVNQSALVTEPANANDSVFSGVPSVTVAGGTLILGSTENEGKISVMEGGALDETAGSTTMTYGPAGNVHIFDGAILPEDWNSALGHAFPLASEIEGSSKIYKGLRGDGSRNPTISGTYAVDDVFKGVASLDNWPTFSGTVTDAGAAGVDLYVQDLRHMILDGADFQTAGSVAVNGGGDKGNLVGYGDVRGVTFQNFTGVKMVGTANFDGMTGAKVMDFNCRGALVLANAGAVPANATVNMNDGVLVCADVGAVAGVVEVNDGGTLLLGSDLSSGVFDLNDGSAVWIDNDSRLGFGANFNWLGGAAKGVNAVLAGNLSALPTDGSINFLRVRQHSNYAYAGTMTLGNNTRVTVAPDFVDGLSNSGFRFIEVDATAVALAPGADQGRIAMMSNEADTYFIIDCPLNFGGKKLIVGDSADFRSNWWDLSAKVGQDMRHLPGSEMIDQQGIVVLGGGDVTDPMQYNVGEIDVAGGTFWVFGTPHYPDPEKLAQVKTIHTATGATCLLTTRYGHDWTVELMFTGNGTVAYLKAPNNEKINELGEKETLIVSSPGDGVTDGGFSPGDSVGTLTVNADVDFQPTALLRCPKVLIDVADHSGDHDVLLVSGAVSNLANADLVATLAVPSVDCKPADVDATFIDAAAGGIAGGDAFHSVSSGLLDAATGLDQTTREAIRDHWDISADDVVYDTVDGDVSLVLDAADWTAIPGDADLDGSVLLGDLSTLAFNWESSTGMTWLTGDFDLNGTVNLADLSALAFHWEETEAGAPPVPEPMTVGLLAVGAAALLRRRHR